MLTDGETKERVKTDQTADGETDRGEGSRTKVKEWGDREGGDRGEDKCRVIGTLTADGENERGDGKRMGTHRRRWNYRRQWMRKQWRRWRYRRR